MEKLDSPEEMLLEVSGGLHHRRRVPKVSEIVGPNLDLKGSTQPHGGAQTGNGVDPASALEIEMPQFSEKGVSMAALVSGNSVPGRDGEVDQDCRNQVHAEEIAQEDAQDGEYPQITNGRNAVEDEGRRSRPWW